MLQSMDKHMQPVKMIDVGHKLVTVRTAEASGSLLLQLKTLEHIRAGELAKGDAINTARVAGIMAAKTAAKNNLNTVLILSLIHISEPTRPY